MARSLHGSTDFRAFYATGKLVALHHGRDIYDLGLQAAAQHNWISRTDQTLPFLYPPFAALLFVPLSYLPFKYAFLAFAAINITILIMAARWVAKELGVQSAGASWPAYALTFGSIATVMALLQGQITCLLLCVFLAALRLARRKHETLAGLVLSLSLMKFQLAIPIILLLFAWKRWAFVRGILSGGAVLTLISLVVTGTTGITQYVRMMSGLAHTSAVDPGRAKATYGMFPSDMPNLHGFAYVVTMGTPASLWITMLLSGLLLIWAARRDRGLPAALCVAMLVSYHFQAYDLVLLLIPLSVALGDILRKHHGSISARWIEVHRGLRNPLSLLAIACGLLIAPVGAAMVYSRISWIFCAAVAAVLTALFSTSRYEVEREAQ